MLNAVISAALFGVPFFALPVAIVSYIMIVCGRRVAGIAGMKVATLGSAVVLVVAPLIIFMTALITFLQIEGLPYPDQIKSVLLSGSLAFNAIVGFGSVLFFQWWDQWDRAQTIR